MDDVFGHTVGDVVEIALAAAVGSGRTAIAADRLQERLPGECERHNDDGAAVGAFLVALAWR